MTTPETTRNYLGIPVTGDISHAERRADQYTHEQVAELFSVVINDPTIKALGWTQRTPYFNDGEPCVFSAFGLWVATQDDPTPDLDDPDDDTEEYGSEHHTERLTVGYGHPTLGEIKVEWVRRPDGKYDKIEHSYVGPDEGRYRRCLALHEAIDGDHCDNVLLELFGDHAQITMTKEKITVETYEHD